MSYKSFKKMFSDVKKDDSYWSEKAKLDFAIELNSLIEKRGMSRADLARALGKTPAYITKILRGENNFTIETMTSISKVLDGKLTLHVTPKEEGSVNWLRVLEGGKKKDPAKSSNWAKHVEGEPVAIQHNSSSGHNREERYEHSAVA